MVKQDRLKFRKCLIFKGVTNLLKKFCLFFGLVQTFSVRQHRFEQKNNKKTEDDIKYREKECRSDTHKKKDFKDDIGTKDNKGPRDTKKEADDLVENASLHKNGLVIVSDLNSTAKINVCQHHKDKGLQ
jgi:hypothetical protein